MPIYDCGSPECDECQRAFGPDRTAAIAIYQRRVEFYSIIATAPFNEPRLLDQKVAE